MSRAPRTALASAFLVSFLLANPALAADLTIDGQTSAQRSIGSQLVLELHGGANLPAVVFVDSSPGPLLYQGELIDLAFTPSAFLLGAGSTSSSGTYTKSAAVPDVPGFVGAQLFLLGAVVDATDPNGIDFSPGVDLTLTDKTGMFVTSCSLGCGGGATTGVSCGAFQVPSNGAISVEFSMAVDFSSVSNQSFQVTNVVTGQAAVGSFSLDPQNPNALVFQPAITFGSGGVPTFGLSEGASYRVHLPGVNQSPIGQYIRDLSGAPLQNSLDCTILAGPPEDLDPGPPTVAIWVDVVTAKDPVTGAVTATAPMLANGGAVLADVHLGSQVELVFDEFMDPVGLVDPITGSSSLIDVCVDLDGDVLTTGDRESLAGSYSIAYDMAQGRTVVLFTATHGLPPKGSQAPFRWIVVELDLAIQDVGGNPLLNAWDTFFQTDTAPTIQYTLPGGTGESFTNTQHEDALRTGASWGAGLLAPGLLGGSGRHGDLFVTSASSPMLLDTDSFQVDGVDVLLEGSASFPPGPGVPGVTVTDGVFEFARIRIEQGAQLVLTGSNAARLFARGQVFVGQGAVVSADGKTAAEDGDAIPGHNSSLLLGGAGGAAGPSAFPGGQGADRPDDTDPSLLAVGGQANPGAQPFGSAGAGAGGGQGGPQWPTLWPTSSTDLSGVLPDIVCRIDMTTAPGAGGGYGTPGGAGVGSIVYGVLNPAPQTGIVAPDTVGGSVQVSALERTLSPELGVLRGGHGGGGGGSSLLLSQTTGLAFGECVVGMEFETYDSHSGAGGGGGGGALQVNVGDRLELRGQLRADGGPGGDGQGAAFSFLRDDLASPGGGGSGGALLVQALDLDLAPGGQRLSVEGGAGGLGAGDFPGSLGGAGGAGLVRAESVVAPDPLALAPQLLPFDATPGSTTGGPASTEILSTGTYQPLAVGPAARSGAQSCWLSIPAPYLGVTYAADDLSDPLNPVLGWDAQVQLTGMAPFSLRDDSDPANPFGASIETLLGSDLGGTSPAPIVVRFQGLRRVGVVGDLCGADLLDSPAVDGDSLTPWVRHPAELNDYWALALPGDPATAAARRPNLIRYQVLFDRSAPFGDLVEGLTHLGLTASLD
ncbi:MAG: hypothetical protein P1V81_12225 [Planctomycetota bacterium]|nr:hypothetical protein [Planctomycetota bacterium]